MKSVDRSSFKATRRKAYTVRARRSKILWGLLIGTLLLAVSVWSLWSQLGSGASLVVKLRDIHGLGYSSDGEQLIVPAHDGLRVYTNQGWQIPNLPANDYMGYSPTDVGFYSSGHPGPGSGETNPLGLVKSTDGGQTLTRLGFEGESDFHLMGVGYFSHAIYVFNPTPNSRLPAGMSYSLDDGTTWQTSALNGIATQPYQIAVHPTDARTVGLATEQGLFLSSDFGTTFILISPPELVTTATFTPDGAFLFFGATQLGTYDLETKQTTTYTIPPLEAGELLTNLAINPKLPGEIALATSRLNLYRSTDGGQSWRQIASEGTGVP